ncbi:hypothetical protein AMTR_s00021p00134770 [Amborella trichopoda]|uniref:Uncharacterized protein n=1 Tax=Amborella trichopoda TaxID=13333 RepID=W1Q0C0_AMBTC|nr:hypothetical protein AMTR_s00021p00134770 [Amborella trichopoda]
MHNGIKWYKKLKKEMSLYHPMKIQNPLKAINSHTSKKERNRPLKFSDSRTDQAYLERHMFQVKKSRCYHDYNMQYAYMMHAIYDYEPESFKGVIDISKWEHAMKEEKIIKFNRAMSMNDTKTTQL